MRAALMAVIALWAFPAGADTRTVPATLQGLAVMPNDTRAKLSGLSPRFNTWGAFSNGLTRAPGLASRPARSDDRPTGWSLPLAYQPVQGVSDIIWLGGDRVLALSDNGLGAKRNSSDSALAFHRLKIDWARGWVGVEASFPLDDPDRHNPFVQLEESNARTLTGADFDPESFVKIGERIWIGDEFGPFLLETDNRGQLRRVVETVRAGQTLRSPDHPRLELSSTPGQAPSFEVRRSSGFEALGASPDGRFVYALFERPLVDEAAPGSETADAPAIARMLAYDTTLNTWDERTWTYTLDDRAHFIGGMTMIDATRALVIERDGGQGDGARACGPGVDGACFPRPARFKKIFLVDVAPTGGALVKRAALDLLAIADPGGRAGGRGAGGVYAMPFVTIESVAVLDAAKGLILVANDNNLPSSMGRRLDAPDDTEFALIEAPGLFIDP